MLDMHIHQIPCNFLSFRRIKFAQARPVSRASIAPARSKPLAAGGLGYPLVFAPFHYQRGTAAVDKTEMLSSGWTNLGDTTQPVALAERMPPYLPLNAISTASWATKAPPTSLLRARARRGGVSQIDAKRSLVSGLPGR